ncbi:MAG: CusA/CzcA family heavy metal efflux RND transporter [Nitrospirota bacterium]
MIAAILAFSLRQRLLVAATACLLAVGGVYAYRALPIDAFPDVTNIQVQILTEAPGLSPVEVERFITFPLELQMTGLPRLTEIRSISKFALSQVTVVFDDQTDIYRARQLVLERLAEAKGRLPEGVEPVMAPVMTGLGEIYQYYLAGPEPSADGASPESRLMTMRTVQDWVIRPALKSVPGVIDVDSLGGFVKQYQVLVHPSRLRKYNLTLHEIFDAVARNNANAGGNVLERHAERAIVRGVGLIRTVEDIENIVVKAEAGTPVFVRDVAEVRIGHAVRHGAAILNGEREVMAGIVLMLRGANAREVVERVKDRVEAIHRDGLLPDGLRIVPFYDRSDLVNAAVETVSGAVLEGVGLVTLILFVLIGNVRSAIVVMATLCLTPLVTFLVMGRVGLSANLMSLGGLAIAIGEIADASIVMVENIHRHLSQPHDASRSRLHVVLQAAKEVGRPTVFGVLIICIVYLPIMTLYGMEGKMFAPLAYTMVIALLVSLALTLTLSPVLSSLLLSGRGTDQETVAARWARRLYAPVLSRALERRGLVVTGSALLLIGTVALTPFLGREFIPILDEGALTPQVIRLPSVSLAESIEMEKRVQKAMLEFPEVRTAVGKIGRSEIAYSPEEPNESDPVVTLRPRDTWTTAQTKAGLVDAIRRRLADVPGISILMSQPIQERVDELISGIRTECAIKLYGDDLDTLKAKADEIAEIMQTVRGVKDLKVEQIAGQPYLTVDIDRHKIARHGINVADIQEIVTTAIGGKPATTVYEGERRFQLFLRFPVEYRNSARAIGDILVRSSSGAPIPLSELAAIEWREGPARISREQVRRRIYVGFNVVGRDIGGVVEEGRQKLAAQLHLPQGYTVVWGGAFENMERAMARLQIIVPLSVGLIFFLLFLSFHSVRYALLMLLNLPFALIGGVAALWVSGQYLSVPASIGFISLFGVAVGNGILLVSTITQLREPGPGQERGMALDEAIVTGCSLRLRPVLMTMLTTLLGLLPLLLAQGTGAEVQRPLATVTIGGLVTSTALTLLVLPALYRWVEERRPAAGQS